MEINYEQLIDPPITGSELVPAEALDDEPGKRKDILDLTLEQERLLGEESAEELMHIHKMLYEKPDIDPLILLPLRKAVINALRKLMYEDLGIADDQGEMIKSIPRQKLEKILHDLDKYKTVNPELYFVVRKDVTNALRKLMHEDLGIAELEPNKNPNQPIPRRETDAQVYEFFPDPDPPPEESKVKKANISRLEDYRKPSPPTQPNTDTKVYQFPQ